jgi:hypothetical protein
MASGHQVACHHAEAIVAPILPGSGGSSTPPYARLLEAFHRGAASQEASAG